MNTNNDNFFNPVKEDKDGVLAKRAIWTTKSIEKCIEAIVAGKKLVANPFYDNNIKLLKGDLVFQRSKEEIIEWKKCAKDIIYFSNTYAQLLTPEGIKHITLRDYQVKYLQSLVENQLSIYCACRQAAKTTTSALFLLHYALFNTDKNLLVLGNKRRTAVEILDKLKKIYLEIPYFLKPGIYKWNESEIVFDNGCRIIAEATTINSGIGFTIAVCLCDEFAHIHPNILEKFYNNIFPVVTAGKAKFIITSTQNGYNLFYRLYKAAEAHENDYVPFKTDWYEVPEWNPEKKRWEKRDEEWHRKQVANYGSEEAFNKQFGTNFDVNANTLIDTRILNRFEQEATEYKPKELPGVHFAEHFYWAPDYDISKMKNDYFVITTDISEGVSGDDTVYTFNKLCLRTSDNTVYTETVGFFKYNKVNADQATSVLKEFCTNYMDINRYLISLEYNLYGELFAKYIIEKIENDPANVYRFNEDVIMKYWNDEMTKYTLGKKITTKSKQMGTSLFKQYYERGEIVNKSIQFVNQVTNFCDTKGNGTYAASFGHDDLVMAQLQMVFVIDNPQYKELCRMFIASSGANEISTSYNPYENGVDTSDPASFMNYIYNQQSENLYDFPNNMNMQSDSFSRLSRLK